MVPLNFHTKCFTHTLKVWFWYNVEIIRALRLKNSYVLNSYASWLLGIKFSADAVETVRWKALGPCYIWSVYDDVIKWKHFPRDWPFVRGIHHSSEFPAQRLVTRSFDIFCDLRLNKRLRKQSWGWWFETASRPLWRYCNEFQRHQLRRWWLVDDLMYELGMWSWTISSIS